MNLNDCVDYGKKADWAKTSYDYAKYRPGPPESFYKKLQAHEVGLSGQKVLDLGTGTGVIARNLAKRGCHVIGADISKGQIEIAKELSRGYKNLEFIHCSSEDLDFEDNSFDIITANQCFLYFDKTIVLPLIKRLLKPKGVFVTSHFSWLPFEDRISSISENLILKHNPNWTGHSFHGEITPINEELSREFKLKGFFYYDEEIEFNRESWRGRMRACRGVGATLSESQVKAFDDEHEEILKSLGLEDFTIKHRIDARILEVRGTQFD